MRIAGEAPALASHFLTQCVFRFFAEDVLLALNQGASAARDGRAPVHAAASRHDWLDRLAGGFHLWTFFSIDDHIYGAIDHK